jgi:hypothetical protein
MGCWRAEAGASKDAEGAGGGLWQQGHHSRQDSEQLAAMPEASLVQAVQSPAML